MLLLLLLLLSSDALERTGRRGRRRGRGRGHCGRLLLLLLLLERGRADSVRPRQRFLPINRVMVNNDVASFRRRRQRLVAFGSQVIIQGSLPVLVLLLLLLLLLLLSVLGMLAVMTVSVSTSRLPRLMRDGSASFIIQ